MLLTRKSVLAAAIETTVGDAETLDASDATFVAYDVQSNPAIEAEERQGEGAFGRHASTFGGAMGRVTFQTDLLGGSTDPKWASVFLPACGWVGDAGVYSPKSAPPGTAAGVKTLTIWFYEDGRAKKLRGCMGAFEIQMTAGRRIVVAWTFDGVWDDPGDAAILDPTFETATPLRFVSSAIAIGAWNPIISSLTINSGNNVIMREDSSKAAGFKSALVTDRVPRGSMDPEAALVATKDVYGDWLDGTQAALSISLGATGNAIAIAAPKFQVTNVQDGNRNLLRTDQIEFQLNKNDDAGDDELTFTFT